MKIEQQVTSLDLSKKLKKLGIEQNTLFYWLKLSPGQENSYSVKFGKEKENVGFSAYTASELGDMLSVFLYGWDTVRLESKPGYSMVELFMSLAPVVGRPFEGLTEAEIRGEMLAAIIKKRKQHLT